MRARRATIVAVLVGTAACGGGDAPDVGLCIRTAPDDPDPLGATGTTRLALRATPFEGDPLLRYFAPNATALRLPFLAFGRWQFAVQAVKVIESGDEVVLATGRTTFVDVEDEHAQIPCVYVATVGTFGQTVNRPPALDPHLAFGLRESATAFIATDEGLVRYDHTIGEFSQVAPLTDPAGQSYELAGAVWADFGGGEAAAILRDGRGLIVDSEGTVKSVVSIAPERLGGLDGAAAVGVGVASVLLIGGAVDPSSLPMIDSSVRVVDLEEGTVTPLAYALPIRDARISPRLPNGAFVVVGSNEGSAEARVPSALVAIVDPAGASRPGSTALLTYPRIDPMVALSGTDVFVLGGFEVDTDQPGALVLSNEIEQLRVNRGRELLYAEFTDTLRVPRAGGVALVTPDFVVVTGGSTPSPEDATTAEEVRFGGSVQCPEACDAPDVPLTSPVSLQLHDGSILVVGKDAAVVYRP